MRRGESSYPLLTGRYITLVIFLVVCGCGILWRMLDLTIFKQEFLKRQGDARTLRVLSIPAYRGIITDRNGEPLAISTPVDSIWVNPQDFSFDAPEVPKLLHILGLKKSHLKKLLKTKREFVYLRRGLDPEIAKKIKDFNIPGLFIQREFRRFYPEGEVTAHLLGFTNIDDLGQEGLELSYNNWLQGVAGRTRVLKDRLGHIIANVEAVQEPVPGNNLALSIDRRIQYLAYRELKSAVELNKAAAGSVIVLDSQTGEVLAMVNQPSFNPNVLHKVMNSSIRNRAVTDLYEPGSLVKSFSIASALTANAVSPNTMIDTNPGWMTLDNKAIKDIHNYGKISVGGVLQHSSNIGITKMMINTPSKIFVNIMQEAGFGQTTESTFPGESAGSFPIEHIHTSHPFSYITMTFGYGLSATPLQMAQSYTIFGNQGKLVPVSLVKLTEPQKSKQVLDPKIASTVLKMLETVVEKEGTGSAAQLEGYRVAGKTGTSRIVGPNGYLKDHHNSAFVGIVPADHPRLIILVVISDPTAGKYYGGSVAAPVFSKVAQGALHILNIMREKGPNYG